MRDFILNHEKRNQVIQKKRQDMPSSYKIQQAISKMLFYSVFIILVLALIMGIRAGFLSDMFFVILILSGILMLIVALIGLSIRAISNNKYLGIWLSAKDCELHLKKSVFEYGALASSGRLYMTWSGRYDEIERLEYDSYNCTLRIFGAMTIKKWTDQDRTRCLSKTYVEKTWSDAKGVYETMVTIPDYFDEFDIFMKELAEKSGKQIIKC